MSGFLRRWSERKAEAQQEAAKAIEPPAAEDLPVSPMPDAPMDPEITAKIAALPEIDEIGTMTDIRPFLQDFVPAALRKAALRRAWAADPVISTHLDVARDYAWEFNSGESPVGFARRLGSDAVQRSVDALESAARKLAGPEDDESVSAPPVEGGDEVPPQPGALQTESAPPVASRQILIAKKHGSALPG